MVFEQGAAGLARETSAVRQPHALPLWRDTSPVGIDERERRLRLRFGPPIAEGPSPAQPGLRRIPRWVVVAGVATALVIVAAAGFLLLTPHSHAAPGCWWWSAPTAGNVTAGDRGCLRGWYQTGGVITEGSEPVSYGLPVAYGDPDQPARHAPCPWRPGDAVVARYHAVFDDGRTIVVIDDCR